MKYYTLKWLRLPACNYCRIEGRGKWRVEGEGAGKLRHSEVKFRSFSYQNLFVDNWINHSGDTSVSAVEFGDKSKT